MDQTNDQAATTSNIDPSVLQPVQYPSWYQSTLGPSISKTVSNTLLGMLPVVNLLLSSRNINILPGTINDTASFLVFIYFCIQAIIGYVRSKNVLGARLGELQRQNVLMSRKLASVGAIEETAKK